MGAIAAHYLYRLHTAESGWWLFVPDGERAAIGLSA